jgi:hypothetical protein
MKVITDAGETIELGTTQTAPTVGIIDYSRRVTDDFGVTTIVERGFARRMSVQLLVPFDAADALQRRLADLRAVPALWVADDRFASLTVRGFYKEFSIDLGTAPLSYCTLTVEGLTGTDGVADVGGDPAPDGVGSTLQLVQPVAVAGGQLIASSVAETDAAEWSATAAYPTGVRVIKAATHRIYESVAAVSAGDDPEAASGKWLDVGPTNRWAMFDQALGSITTGDQNVTVTVNVGAIDAVALLDVVAGTVRVQAAGYDRTVPAGAGAITFLDLPATQGPVTVTIAAPGTVSIGTLLVGHRVALGLTEASPTAGITDYSRKVVDDFGAVTIVQRAWAKRMTANALIRTVDVDVVANRIAAVRARPSLWIGQAGLDSLTVYGFFKEFSIEVGESVSKLSLSIEGLSTAGKVEPLGASVNWPDIADPTGTKPADNADVTGDNTSKDTHAVGGRTAAEVLQGMDINTLGLLGSILNGDELNQMLQAMATVSGQPVSVSFLDFKGQQLGVNQTQAYQINLISARNADNNAFILEVQRVMVDKTTALSTRLDQVTAQSGGVQASVQLLMEALVSDGIASSKAILRADANGVFGGVSITAGGEERLSEIAFFADELEFVDRNGGGAPIKALYYADGVWQLADNLYVKNLFADTVTTKHIVAGSVTGNMTASFPDQAVGPAEVTLAEWSGIVLGDGIDGHGLAQVTFVQDGSTTVDTAMTIRAYVKTGTGAYQRVRSFVQGIQVSSGNARWILPVSFNISLLYAGTVAIKITAQGYSLGGGPTSGSSARNIQIDLFTGAR